MKEWSNGEWIIILTNLHEFIILFDVHDHRGCYISGRFICFTSTDNFALS